MKNKMQEVYYETKKWIIFTIASTVVFEIIYILLNYTAGDESFSIYFNYLLIKKDDNLVILRMILSMCNLLSEIILMLINIRQINYKEYLILIMIGNHY